MKNVSTWRETKYVRRNGRLRATADDRELAAGSRLMADLVAGWYDQAIADHATGALLDMGCGKAPLYGLYRDYVSDAQLIDREQSVDGAGHLDQACDLNAPVPYPDRSFDTILLSDVLEHLPEPVTCWAEMNRLLRPGGKVIMNVPFYYQVHEAPHDYYRYTEFALRRFAENAGFEVVELTPIGGAIEILADITGKLLARLRPLSRAVQSVALWWSSTAVGGRFAKRTGSQFPLGYAMVVVKQN